MATCQHAVRACVCSTKNTLLDSGVLLSLYCTLCLIVSHATSQFSMLPASPLILLFKTSQTERNENEISMCRHCDKRVTVVAVVFSSHCKRRCSLLGPRAGSSQHHCSMRLERIQQTLYRYNFNLFDSKGNYSATSNNTKLVHWPLMGGLLHLVQRGGAWASCSSGQSAPRCTKCNSPLINGQCTNHRIAIWWPVALQL